MSFSSWNNYNQAMTNEKLLFLELLYQLCNEVPSKPNSNQRGRPCLSYNQMLFCIVCKVYEQLSSRRVNGDIELARQKGYINKTPHFNTILNYFNEPCITRTLVSLIQLSSLPLRNLEDTFAIDSTGLSSAFYSRWLDSRLDHKEKYHDWIKVHLICGVKSNIVTHVIITEGNKADSPHFPELLKKTKRNFNIEEILADKAYSSRDNIQLAWSYGITPFIPFRNNSTSKSLGNRLWREMFYYFQNHRQEFLNHYHKRSNVESTFSMLKRKFQGKLMLKGEVGQCNEALAKILCHNICILIKEYYEGNIILGFKQLTKLIPELDLNPIYKYSMPENRLT